jgi:hypothetical protein
LKKQKKKTLPPEPAVRPVRSRTLSEVPTLKICCARRTAERTGYKVFADPDIVPKSMSTPEDHPDTDEAAAKRFPDRPPTPSRGVGHDPLPEPGG